MNNGYSDMGTQCPRTPGFLLCTIGGSSRCLYLSFLKIFRYLGLRLNMNNGYSDMGTQCPSLARVHNKSP